MTPGVALNFASSALARLRAETTADLERGRANLAHDTEELVPDHPADYAGLLEPTLSAVRLAVLFGGFMLQKKSS